MQKQQDPHTGHYISADTDTIGSRSNRTFHNNFYHGIFVFLVNSENSWVKLLFFLLREKQQQVATLLMQNEWKSTISGVIWDHFVFELNPLQNYSGVHS